jgi:LacI family transcriptional regulator
MTMRELARLAGVSQATVSLALRNHPRISPATKTRVARLVRKHRYVVDGRVSELMRSIRVHSSGELTGCIGLISLYAEEEPWLPVHQRTHLGRLRKIMIQRAAELGYRVEPFWVRNPDMSVDRLRAIMESRGIQGLLSLGAPELEDAIPSELRQFVIVTQGTSISTRLHRIVSHFAHNATLLLTELKRRGYRRPGAVLQQHQDGRNAHLVAAMYLYYSRYVFDGLDIPILYSGVEVESGELDRWFRQHRPDVIVYADHEQHYASLRRYFDQRQLAVPADLGLAVLDAVARPKGISGVRQDLEQMGINAVDMLVSRLQQGETGLAAVPKVECVEGRWFEGETLRAVE